MKTGAFRRKKINFTQVSNHIIQNPNVSTSAKGLYTIINSYINIPNWVLYKSFLLTVCKEKETAFDRMWKELKTLGYLKQYKIKDHETGRFIYEYELLDEPEIQEKNQICPPIGKPTPRKSTHGKHRVYNNNDLNNINNNNNNNTKESVVVDESIFLSLSKEIKSTIGEKVGDKKLKELINLKGKDIINKYLTNWDKFKHDIKKSAGAKFIDAVENEYDIPNKTSNTYLEGYSANCEQRQYTSEDFEKYYYKVEKENV